MPALLAVFKLLLVALSRIRFYPLVILRLSLLCSSALLTRVFCPLCAQVSAMLTMKVNGTEMLVTGGPNGTLGIFDLTVLKQVGEAHGHTAPDGGWLVTGGDIIGRTTGLERSLLCERGRVRSSSICLACHGVQPAHGCDFAGRTIRAWKWG